MKTKKLQDLSMPPKPRIDRGKTTNKSSKELVKLVYKLTKLITKKE